MNYLELVKEVCAAMDYAEPTTLVTPDTETLRAMRAVNRAYNSIWVKLNKGNEDAETEVPLSLTAGTDVYNIPAALADVSFVVMADTTVCRIIPWVEFELRKNKGTWGLQQAELYPQDIALYQRKIYFYPSVQQDQVITIRGRQKYADLADDEDIPTIRTELHRAIIELAKYYEMVYEGNPDVQIQETVVTEWLDMARSAQRSHGGFPPRIMSEDEWEQDFLARNTGY